LASATRYEVRPPAERWTGTTPRHAARKFRLAGLLDYASSSSDGQQSPVAIDSFARKSFERKSFERSSEGKSFERRSYDSATASEARGTANSSEVSVPQQGTEGSSLAIQVHAPSTPHDSAPVSPRKRINLTLSCAQPLALRRFAALARHRKNTVVTTSVETSEAPAVAASEVPPSRSCADSDLKVESISDSSSSSRGDPRSGRYTFEVGARVITNESLSMSRTNESSLSVSSTCSGESTFSVYKDYTSHSSMDERFGRRTSVGTSFQSTSASSLDHVSFASTTYEDPQNLVGFARQIGPCRRLSAGDRAAAAQSPSRQPHVDGMESEAQLSEAMELTLQEPQDELLNHPITILQQHVIQRRSAPSVPEGWIHALQPLLEHPPEQTAESRLVSPSEPSTPRGQIAAHLPPLCQQADSSRHQHSSAGSSYGSQSSRSSSQSSGSNVQAPLRRQPEPPLAFGRHSLRARPKARMLPAIRAAYGISECPLHQGRRSCPEMRDLEGGT